MQKKDLLFNIICIFAAAKETILLKEWARSSAG